MNHTKRIDTLQQAPVSQDLALGFTQDQDKISFIGLSLPLTGKVED